MTTQIQRRRGTTAQHSTFTGAEAELTVDTTKDTVVVHDGATAGGRPLLREDQANLPNAVTNGLSVPSTNTLALSTNGTGRLFVDASGNVGVGAAPIARALEVNTSLQIGAVFKSTSTAASRLSLQDANSTDDSRVGIGAIGDNCALYAGASERLRITSAGLVGIGTSAPQTLLHLSSATGDATPTPTELRIATTTNGIAWSQTNPWGRISYYSSDNSGSGPKIQAAIDVTSSNSGGSSVNLDFKLDDGNGALNTRMLITPAGDVGIGTASPLEPLHIESSSADLMLRSTLDSGNSRIFFGDPSATNAGLISYAHSDNSLSFTVNAGEKARIDSSGRLLVGTSSQSGGALLQVNGDRIRVATAKTPASATDTGTAGEICWDANYVYVCTATNTWKRSALSTW